MNSTQNTEAIATSEFNWNLESVAQYVVPEPVDPVAARLRAKNHQRVKEDIETGELLWQKKQSFKRLKDFKVWLVQQGFAPKSAYKYLKLYETFACFPIEQIEWVDIDTLCTLCQPRYRSLLQKLRSLPLWVDAKVQELMEQFRAQKKPHKPGLEKDAGWRQVPGGGRAFKLPLLHDEQTGMRLVQIQKEKNQTVQQIIKEAIALLFDKLTGQPKRQTRYILYTRGCEQCANKTKILKQASRELLTTNNCLLRVTRSNSNECGERSRL